MVVSNTISLNDLTIGRTENHDLEVWITKVPNFLEILFMSEIFSSLCPTSSLHSNVYDLIKMVLTSKSIRDRARNFKFCLVKILLLNGTGGPW